MSDHTTITETPAAVPLDDLSPILAAYVNADRQVTQWTQARDGLRRAIEAHLGAAEVGTVGGRPRVRRTRYTERRLDVRRLREQAPADLVEACTVARERTRFSLVEDDPA